MADVQQAPPGDRNNQIYNAAERAILDPYKSEYVAISAKAARKQFFTSRIWPAMYRYWVEKHSLSSNLSRIKAKDLSGWIYNNWRLPHTGGKTKGILTVRKSDVLWKMRQADVWKEIARILNVPEASTKTEKWFPTRTIAIQNIISRMDANETKLLEQQVRDIEENGYPEEQRRAFAEKHSTRRLDTAAKAHWLEMGLLTLSVVAYRRTDGRLSVEIHENASSLVGVGEHCFDDEHEGKAREIRRVWLDYVRNILEEKEGGAAPIGHADADLLVTSQDGFPMFPNGFSPEKLKKKQGEKMLREYLKQNYALTTGRQSDEVPYKEMTKSIAERRKFIHDRFLPRGFILRDPHNLKLEEIQKVLQFLWDRQQCVAAAQVFRFHAVKASRKGLEINPSMYSDEIDPNNPPEIRKKKPRKQKRTAVPPANAEKAPRETEHPAPIFNQPGLYTMSATPEPQTAQATNDPAFLITTVPTPSQNMLAAKRPPRPDNEPMPIPEFPDWVDAMPPPIEAGSAGISVNPSPHAMDTLPVNSWENHAFGNAMSANNAFGNAMSANNAFGNAISANNAFGNAMSGNHAFGNAMSGNHAFGNAMSGNHAFGNAMSGNHVITNAMPTNHPQIYQGYDPTIQFMAEWNPNLNQSLGINGYAPGPEGIDYGVPLNLESVEHRRNNAEDHDADTFSMLLPAMQGPTGNPPFVAELESYNQHGQSSLNQFTNMLPQIPNYTSAQTRQNQNDKPDMNAGANAEQSTANQVTQALHAKPQRTNVNGEMIRNKRTADDVAAAEAAILSSTRLATKRQRKPKVRES